ncbi:MAG: hypothetical protein ACLQQ4_08155 [Bacteroidia bacterium]
MKHEFIGEPIRLASRICEITVRLIPENAIEIDAIENLEITKIESSLINNYLLSNILNWPILSIKSQKGKVFKLKAVNI